MTTATARAIGTSRTRRPDAAIGTYRPHLATGAHLAPLTGWPWKPLRTESTGRTRRTHWPHWPPALAALTRGALRSHGSGWPGGPDPAVAALAILT